MNPIKIVMGFMYEMKLWEVSLYGKKREMLLNGKDISELDRGAKEQLERIFATYVISDKHNTERTDVLNCADPPTYDPDSDVISLADDQLAIKKILIKRSKPVVVTYTVHLQKVGESWMLKRRERLGANGKWSRVPF